MGWDSLFNFFEGAIFARLLERNILPYDDMKNEETFCENAIALGIKKCTFINTFNLWLLLVVTSCY